MIMHWSGLAGMRVCLMLAMLVLSSCGYHLVGHGGGRGAIPADVQRVSIVGNVDSALLSLLKQRLASDQYSLVDAASVTDQAHHALLSVRMSPLVFVPSAYDLSGVATQYRMVFSGTLMLEQDGKTVWQSGVIQRQGDVYVSGGPASIEASRIRLLQDLQKQWVVDAVGRVRSGF